MYDKGQKVVIRDSQGNDQDTGYVEEVITEEEGQFVKVRTDSGVRVVKATTLVEHLED